MLDLDELRSKYLNAKHYLLDKWDDLKSDPRKLMVVIGVVFFIIGVGLGYSNNAHGQTMSLSKGEVLQHMLSVCIDKDDAIEILKVDSEKGREEAGKVWEAKEKCAAVPVQGLMVGNGETIQLKPDVNA